MQSSLIIIHLVLEGISTAGCPAKMVYEFLRGFFKDNGSLQFEEVIFNLKDDVTTEEHEEKMQNLAKDLAK